MTPEEEFDQMLQRMRAWPPATRLEHHRDLFRLVKAGHAMAGSESFSDAGKYLLCDHGMSGMIRPLILMLFNGIDDSIQAACAKQQLLG